jgi:hypothetical protein
MIDPFAGGKRLALRMLYAQLVAVGLVSIVVLLVVGSLSIASAVAWGGTSVVLAQATFAWRQFAGVASAATMLRRFFGAAAWKWLLLFAVFGTGLIVLKLPAGGLLTGLITAQLAGMWALLRYG